MHERGGGHGYSSIPETLHVPAVVQPVEVQIPDRAAAGLHPPVLPIPTVFPPPPLDLPSTDHVDHHVSATSPLEGRRHPPIPFDPDLLVDSLGHLWPAYPNVCSSGRLTVRLGCDIRQDGGVPAPRRGR